MRQQINLYQPIFREQRKLFSSRVVGMALGAVLVTLTAIYAYGQWQVASLEHQLEALRKEQQANETRMASLGALQGARSNTKAIEDTINALTVELAVRTRALQVLQSGGAGHTTGFATRLEALARGHVDGLWLDHLILSSEGAAMSLSGATTNPALVPRYLQGLSAQPALSGARFDQFVIEGESKSPSQAKPEGVAQLPAGALRFRAGSSIVVPDKADAT